jgi:hypothetical protein
MKVDGIEITKCFNSCPYFVKSHGPMMCGHPDVGSDFYIISHPDCDNGFPEKCPLNLGARCQMRYNQTD